MDIITINLKEINKIEGLNLRLYLSLYYLYCLKNDPKLNQEFIKAHGPVSSEDALLLQKLKYLKVTNYQTGDYEIREDARLIFEGKKDLFYTWLLGFPIKTAQGRYLSPKTEDTVKGRKLRAKWKKLFGNDTLIQERVIEILAAELKWRKDTGKIEFMHNAETWLNQGDWENYEYLVDEQEVRNKINNEDFI